MKADTRTDLSMLSMTRMCPINKLPITRPNCLRISGDEFGNGQCQEHDCDSPFYVCEICVEQVPKEIIIAIGNNAKQMVIATVGRRCLEHHKDRNFQLQETQLVSNAIKKLAEAGKKAPDLDPDEQEEPEDVPSNLAGNAQDGNEPPPKETKPEKEAKKTAWEGLALEEPIDIPPPHPLEAHLGLVRGEHEALYAHVSELKPSLVGPQHHFHECELVRKEIELRLPNYQTLWVAIRAQGLEVVRGEGLYQAALRLGIEKLRVKIVSFESQREEFLSAAIANQAMFCTAERVTILAELKACFPEWSEEEIGARLQPDEPGKAFADYYAFFDLHPDVRMLMMPQLPPGKRLELDQAMRFGFHEMTPLKQCKMARELDRIRKIGVLVPLTAEEIAILEEEAARADRANAEEIPLPSTDGKTTEEERVPNMERQAETGLKDGAAPAPGSVAKPKRHYKRRLKPVLTEEVPASQPAEEPAPPAEMEAMADEPTGEGSNRNEVPESAKPLDEPKHQCPIFETAVTAKNCAANKGPFCGDLACPIYSGGVSAETNATPEDVSDGQVATAQSDQTLDIDLAWQFADLVLAGRSLDEVAELYGYETAEPVALRLSILDYRRLDTRILELMEKSVRPEHRLLLSEVLSLIDPTKKKLDKNQYARALEIQARKIELFP